MTFEEWLVEQNEETCAKVEPIVREMDELRQVQQHRTEVLKIHPDHRVGNRLAELAKQLQPFVRRYHEEVRPDLREIPLR